MKKSHPSTAKLQRQVFNVTGYFRSMSNKTRILLGTHRFAAFCDFISTFLLLVSKTYTFVFTQKEKVSLHQFLLQRNLCLCSTEDNEIPAPPASACCHIAKDWLIPRNVSSSSLSESLCAFLYYQHRNRSPKEQLYWFLNTCHPASVTLIGNCFPKWLESKHLFH